MKLTRQRKISIVVLSVAAAALAADRLFFGPSILSVAAASSSAGGGEAIVATGAAAPVSMVCVAERLESLRASATDSIDAFAAPAGWLPPQEAEIKTKGAKPEKIKLPQLTGVFPRARGDMSEAIINKQHVHEGDVVDGWQVVKIRAGSVGKAPAVLVARGERREELTMDPVFSNPRSRMTPKTNAVQSAATSEDGGVR